MNYNGGEMRNMNNRNSARKRKLYDPHIGNKRFRYLNGPRPQKHTFKNAPWNRASRPNATNVQNETADDTLFHYSPPSNLDSRTSLYDQNNHSAPLNASNSSNETVHNSLFDYVPSLIDNSKSRVPSYNQKNNIAPPVAAKATNEITHNPLFPYKPLRNDNPKFRTDSYGQNNHTLHANATKTSNEPSQNLFAYKSPIKDNLKPQTSPYDPKNPSTGIYSANNRIKALRQAIGATAPSNHFEENSNHSCSNSSSSRCSNPKPCYMGKPSSIQERLKNIKNTFQSSANLSEPSVNSNEGGSRNLIFSGGPSNEANASDDESMDWCAFEEKEVLNNITKLRESNSISKIAPSTTFQQKLSDALVKLPANESMYREIFIVTDTNIFLSNLDLIGELLKLKVNSVCSPCIMIPWTVIQELDYLKDSMLQSTLKNNAKAAIRFINEKLTSNHPQVKGQSVHDAAEQNFACKNADDAILFCCLQIKERQHNPILLSNDINLRNKAIINGVMAYSHKTIIDGLDPYRDTGDGLELQPGFDYSKLKAVEVLFSNFFSFIIHTKLLDAYGSSRDIMHPDLKTPPWSLMKCLTLLKKFWRPIFSVFLKRQFIYTVNQYIEFLSKHEDLVTMGPSKIKIFVNTGLELFEYIEIGCAVYKENVMNSRKKIEEITKDFFVYKK